MPTLHDSYPIKTGFSGFIGLKSITGWAVIETEHLWKRNISRKIPLLKHDSYPSFTIPGSITDWAVRIWTFFFEFYLRRWSGGSTLGCPVKHFFVSVRTETNQNNKLFPLCFSLFRETNKIFVSYFDLKLGGSRTNRNGPKWRSTQQKQKTIAKQSLFRI